MHSKYFQATEITESVYGEAEKSKGGNRNEENMYVWTTRHTSLFGADLIMCYKIRLLFIIFFLLIEGRKIEK